MSPLDTRCTHGPCSRRRSLPDRSYTTTTTTPVRGTTRAGSIRVHPLRTPSTRLGTGYRTRHLLQRSNQLRMACRQHQQTNSPDHSRSRSRAGTRWDTDQPSMSGTRSIRWSPSTDRWMRCTPNRPSHPQPRSSQPRTWYTRTSHPSMQQGQYPPRTRSTRRTQGQRSHCTLYTRTRPWSRSQPLASSFPPVRSPSTWSIHSSRGAGPRSTRAGTHTSR